MPAIAFPLQSVGVRMREFPLADRAMGYTAAKKMVLHGFPGNAALIFRKKKSLSR
jgi:hypothetical protein